MFFLGILYLGFVSYGVVMQYGLEPLLEILCFVFYSQARMATDIELARVDVQAGGRFWQLQLLFTLVITPHDIELHIPKKSKIIEKKKRQY
jgi:hypothetical protein